MPAPGRTTNDDIVAAALALVDLGGPDALTMQAVAARVGVRAPSLYKRVENREHLLGLVAERVALDVGSVLERAQVRANDDPHEGVVAMARALRGYAMGHPHRFRLMLSPLPDAARPSRDALARSSQALLAASDSLAGSEHALDAARTVTAWAFGFLTMELAGAFQLGGDPSEAFEFGAAALARSIDARSAASPTV